MRKLSLVFSRFLHKLRKAGQMSQPDCGDFLLACVDLAIARIVLMTVRPKRLLTCPGFLLGKKGMIYTVEAKENRVQRVAKAIALAARNVPWRSDCLVQALAARRRLHIAGLDSELRLGVCKRVDGSFVAHAWLLHGDTMVTGGDVSEYSRLI